MSRDIKLEDTIYMKFTSRAFATGIPTTLAGTPVVSAYENDSVTQITAGITLGADHDSVTGLNHLTIVATAANGFEDGKDYDLVITTGTVSSVSVVGEVVGEFTIGRSAAKQEIGTAGVGLTNVTLGDNAHGGTSAVITVERIVVVSTTFGQPGITSTGSGPGPGIYAEGGSTSAAGIGAQGGGSGGQGIRSAGGTNGIGILAEGGSTAGNAISLSTNIGDGIGISAGLGNGIEISATGDGIVSTGVSGDHWLDLTKEVWDRVLTGATHNIATSAGRRLRNLQDFGVYAEASVWVDEIGGTSTGTTDFEDATVNNRANDFDNAQAVAASVGLDQARIQNGNTITLSATLNGFTIWGELYSIALGGQDVGATKFIGVNGTTGVTGIATGTTPAFENCLIGNVTLPPCRWDNCTLDGTFTIGSAGAFRLFDCKSGVAGAGSPVIDMGAAVGATTLELRNWSNGLTVNNLAAGDVLTLSGRFGTITLNGADASVEIRGTYKGLVNNLTGSHTVNLDGAILGGDVAAILLDTGTDGVVLASSEDVYHADVELTVDEANTQDEYTAVFMKNGVRVTDATTPLIQVIKRADETDLIAETAMSQFGMGVSGGYKYTESTNRVTAGEAVLVLVTATMDGSPRPFPVVPSRDSTA